MAAYDIETTILAGQLGSATATEADPLRNDLNSISGGAYALNPLADPPAGQNAFARVKLGVGGGGVNFCWGHPFDAGFQGDALVFGGMPFGMTSPEVMSWWYQGGGAAAFAAALLAVGDDVVCFPMPRFAEGGGWYREAITLQKFLSGQYDDGTSIKFRIFGDGAAALNRAFPNVSTPPATPNVSFLGDLQAGVYNGGEYGDVAMDSSIIGGLFPNWPLKDGSVVDALGGRPHYYPGSWHTPARIQCVWVNKTWYDALPAQDQDWIRVAVKSTAMNMMAQALAGQDAILTTMKGLGVVVHESHPPDILERLRDEAQEAMDASALADANYNAILTSMRTFAKANQFRQRSLNTTLLRRFRHTRLQGDFEPDSVY